MILLVGLILALAGGCLIVIGITEDSGDVVKLGLISGAAAIFVGFLCINSGLKQDIQQDQLDGKMPIEIGKVIQWRDGTTQTIPMNHSIGQYRKEGK